eukprot:CAMPEP_0195508436 /NCGR_PEP_ID=MMETSP0794_2-20130614/1639_1 /TAXON_ID=515487 /ORGANISM="Stephanopyxis turris, Strain CCMP 815" /LENGTH=150 /DNA_ID=CAMNT_0040635395 /DNA_START=149 /DNA_END=598 /DNA_ORIENTATION=+
MSVSAPVKLRTLVDDHYRVDANEKVVLPGVPAYDDDFARDSHDFFNLIALVPLVVLNILNWNLDILLDGIDGRNMEKAWTGEWFAAFWWATLIYFGLDLIWVALVPSCVKSPGTIIKHHIATLVYILVPYLNPEYQWCMGVCMSVEINTW